MKKRFLAIVPATVLMLIIGACTSSTSSTSNTGGAAASNNGASAPATNDGGLATLRAAPVAAAEKTPTGDGLKNALETDLVDRNFDDQPPLVSHEVDKYPVTLKTNGCMDCHSEQNYKKEKATKVPVTHYVAASGKTLPNLSSRRHFCLQCHIPQVDAKPLVDNTFQQAK
ncbi:MAG: nitrate reductase cytochrome c-type subunit [Betaproteobacteria bacterium]|nr:nitrate reductase cytochrome c-type subunit [Betaproteobacteria bacterium]MCL2162510.1 nitrate reductase cytochrome c-type subunit [Betaproteobacteria bacterium]